MAIGSVSAIETQHCPCLKVVDSLPFSGSGGADHLAACWSTVASKRSPVNRPPELRCSLLGSWDGHRVVSTARRRQQQLPKRKRAAAGQLVVVSEIAGNYEENFGDVESQITNYFTYKAVRTVLHQLYEMNPPSYMWFYNFVATNEVNDGRRFLRKLTKEKQDLAERVMITRLHLYGRWVKKCDHAKIYQSIADDNLKLMRERLMETIVFPSDDTNTEKIG